MVLKLEDIRLSFDGFCVLDNLSLHVKAGEFVCLLGPSGCGKTSTLRVCAGLESPLSGRVMLGDKIVTDGTKVLPPEKRHIGFLFQDFALFPHLNIFQNVAFGLNGYRKEETEERVLEVLKQVRMDKYASALPHTLSGGQQQRVALARALAPKPGIMLLDEPFSGLDSGLRADIRDETLHVLKSTNVAAVMVTHDPEEAMFMADRIVLMKGGSIIQDGAPHELYTNPIDHFAASFFGEINIIKGIIKESTAQTILGNVKTSGFKEGEIVDVLIRPENVIVRPRSDVDQHFHTTKIEAARYLGRDSLLHLCVEDETGAYTHLHARIDSQLKPIVDQNIVATMDPARAFVFRAC